MPAWRREFFAGIIAELPLLLGVIPFGLIYGVLALQAGLPAGVAFAMSSIVFAGSAQFAATQLFAVGAPGGLILFTTVILNLRHLLYSASLAPYLAPLRPAWKWLLAYLLTDEAYAVTIMRYRQPPSANAPTHWFFFGAGLTLWTAWQVSTVLGLVLGAQVPSRWRLDFALPLTFIALAIPTLTDSASVTSAVVAGVIAVVTISLPLRLGLTLGVLAGILSGLWVEQTSAARRPKAQRRSDDR